MGEIKSAFEKAMEKVEKMGKPSEEELKRLQHFPAGNALAAKYLNDEKFNLDAELGKYKGSGARQYIIDGAMEIFLRNITLPHDEREKMLTGRALTGIRMIKENKKQLDTIFEHIKNIIGYYEQTRQHTFAQFKKDFETKIKESPQMLQQMAGRGGGSVEAQLQMQFQDEWRRASQELDSKYEKALEEQKQMITGVS
jgi:hypothetical protein